MLTVCFFLPSPNLNFELTPVDGILSSDPKKNPYLWNANHIYVPYCSSDSWTGLLPASTTHSPQASHDHQHNQYERELRTSGLERPGSFAFLGSKIVERVFESLYDDLPIRQSLYDAKYILLAGDSAGATGVMLNLDKIAGLVEKRSSYLRANCTQNQQCELKQSDPVLRGLADSGWFLDNEPYNFESELSESTGGGAESYQKQSTGGGGSADCDQGRCTPLQSIRRAMQLWNGQVPEACMQSYASEPWRCYFGYRVYQTLRTPLFVVQWLYDEAQLMVDNIVRPGTVSQWNYVNKVVNEMRASLENVTALFAPLCLSHSLIAHKSWSQININGFRLPHILNSWEEQPLQLDMATNPTSGGYPMAISSSSSSSSTSSPPNFISKVDAPIQNHHQMSGGGMITFENGATIVEQQHPSSSQSTTLATGLAAPNSMDSAASYMRSANRLLAQESRNQIMTNRQSSAAAAASSPNTGSASSNGQAAKSRSRKRKRNNQQQQNRIKQSSRQKSQQQQQTTTTTTQNGPLDFAPSIIASQNPRDADDLQQQQQPTPSPIQDLLSPSDRSLGLSSELLYGRVNRANLDQSGFRLSRSSIVDDATLMLSNNVPDDASRLTLAQLSMAPPTAAILHTAFQDQSSESARWTTDSRPQVLNPGSYATSSKDTNGPDQFRFIDTCGWPQCNRDCPVQNSDFYSGISIQF